MSTLVTSNISDGTTSVGTGYVVNGSAKAWVNFNGTGTVAVRDSFNTSSIADNGTGTYRQNYSSALGASNSSSAGCTQLATAYAFAAIANPTDSKLDVGTFWNTGMTTLTDVDDCEMQTHGDLA